MDRRKGKEGKRKNSNSSSCIDQWSKVESVFVRCVQERERERRNGIIFTCVSGRWRREEGRGEGERERGRRKHTARCAVGQIWLVNVFVELLKAIDETEAAMIYD